MLNGWGKFTCEMDIEIQVFLSNSYEGDMSTVDHERLDWSLYKWHILDLCVVYISFSKQPNLAGTSLYALIIQVSCDLRVNNNEHYTPGRIRTCLAWACPVFLTLAHECEPPPPPSAQPLCLDLVNISISFLILRHHWVWVSNKVKI